MKLKNNKLLISFLAALFLSITVFLFGPFHLYFSNVLDFSYSFSQVWIYFVLITLLSTSLITVFLLIFSGNVHKKVVSIVLVLSVLLWFQGNVLVFDYGVLDGKNIMDLSDYNFYKVLDAVVWISLIILGFIFYIRIYKTAKYICVFFIFIQLLAMGFMYFNASGNSLKIIDDNIWEESDSAFAFSEEKNVLVLLFDGFESDVFLNIIENEQSNKKIFDGFSYYPNSLSGFPTTYASIPLIMTGEYYDNSIPIQDFINESLQNHSIPHNLKSEGYQVDLITSVYKTLKCNELDISDNCLSLMSLLDTSNFFRSKYLVGLSLFRHSPHFMKEFIYNNIDWFVSSSSDKARYMADLDFLDIFEEKAKLGAKTPTFKFFHFSTPHSPNVFNENCEFEKLNSSEKPVVQQSKCALKMIGRVIDSLKGIGAYDNSLIFIIADHGNVAFASESFDYSMLNIDVSQLYFEENADLLVKSFSFPLVLLKPFDSNGELKTLMTPISLSDLPKTIFSELGIENEFSGSSILDLKEDEDRDRRYLYYEWDHDFWKKEYLPAMHEYIVSDFCWLDSSWKSTGKIYEGGE